MRWRNRALRPPVLLICAAAAALGAPQQARRVDRVIVIKVDGLPESFVDRFSTPSRAGASKLPWIEKIFRQEGTWLNQFYVRGLSLSAPSWSLLDTGRHLEIRGNVEYDRYTLRAHDYLNFFPFYVGYARRERVDMPAVELLDDAGIPLLIDRFRYEERFQGFQLFQRGVVWDTLKAALLRTFRRNPKEIFDEWQTGLSMSSKVSRQTEQELIEDLAKPGIRYLDYFAGDYDHVAHLTADPVSQLYAMQEIDGLVGRIWAAVSKSPYADTTVMFLLSDHGMNTTEGIFSQGFNFVDWFSSTAGGGHHVLTNRHPLTEFKLKGLDPFVSEVITPSQAPTYLADQQALYPTVMLDLDGNERACIGLRNNTLNKLQVLLDQLTRRKLAGPVRRAALTAFFSIRDAVKPDWEQDLRDLGVELAALDARIEADEKHAEAEPRKKKWTDTERALGVDKVSRRVLRRLEIAKEERDGYRNYAQAIRRLMALTPADFDPGKFRIESVIPPKSLGPLNHLRDLEQYVVGPARGGLVLAPDGSLDLDHAFQTIDYLAALTSLRAHNNVQPGVPVNPVDFLAIRVPDPTGQAVWLYRSPDKQVLVQAAYHEDRSLEIRYTPVSHVGTDAEGKLQFQPTAWSPGLPLNYFEDPLFGIGEAARMDWMNQWHSDREWFEATYRTRYSNGIIGLVEEMLDAPKPQRSGPEQRYLERKSRLRRTDLLVMASDHWNFNVRGFNPGGNHGSFLRESTHSVLLATGGSRTGIPRGIRIDTPYDSLSFVPTVLTLINRPEKDLPGPVIRELIQ